jgi:hypothetical protein
VKRSIPLLAALVLLPAASARAGVAPIVAGTETAASGAVTASVSWQAGESPMKLTLTITRAGVVAFNQPIPNVCDDSCSRSASDSGDFQVADLDGDGEPEVLVRGDNVDRCCDDNLGIYHYDAATGTYREFFNRFDSLLLETRRNKTLLSTDDERFDTVSHDEFKLLPPRILAYEAGPKLVDVSTTLARTELTSDAHLRRFELDDATHKFLDLNRSYAIIYVADEYRLGKGPAALKYVDAKIAAGLLGSPKTAAGLRKRLVSAIHRYGYA